MKIDDLIKESGDQMNIESPPIDVWVKIRSEWKAESKRTPLRVWKIAASILLISTFGLFLYTNSLRHEIDELASLGDISTEYQVLESQYQSEIVVLEKTIPFQVMSKTEDYSWLLDELETLDEVNQFYRADIGRVGNDEILIKVLIDYYEKKIKLLRKLELEFNRKQQNSRSENRKETQS